MIPRALLTDEHALFRDQARRVIDHEVLPQHAKWGVDSVAPREIWRKPGAADLLYPAIAEHYGGGAEEVMRELAARQLGFHALGTPG
ncbi:MAG: acyl-CoA dehydrogenase family protein [Betaproteobacteria bacterium]|nr:acyl-CoA dehydrogenase family protein [Betaproteobacteria bacterium]